MSTVAIEQAMRAAFAHHQAGRLREAEHIYRQVLAVQPEHFEALQLLGLVAHATGHNDAAVELMSKALRVNPAAAGVRANLAFVYRSMGRPEEAIANAEAAPAAEPTLPPAPTVRAASL